jgi:hypothetical protein
LKSALNLAGRISFAAMARGDALLAIQADVSRSFSFIKMILADNQKLFSAKKKPLTIRVSRL